jgi:hypothetical protein
MKTTEVLAAALVAESASMWLELESVAPEVRAMFLRRAANLEEKLRSRGIALVEQRRTSPWKAKTGNGAVSKSAKRKRDSKPAKRQRSSNLQRSGQ